MARIRRWHCFRWHWLTWVGILVVTGTAADCQLQRQISFFTNAALVQYGWPIRAVEVHVTFDDSYSRNSVITSERWSWGVKSLVFDACFCFVLAASTARVLEIWIRSPKRWQFSLRTLFGLTAVVAVITALVRKETVIDDWIETFDATPSRYGDWHDLSQPLHLPIMFALACAIFEAGRIAGRAIAKITAGNRNDEPLSQEAANQSRINNSSGE